MVQAAQVNCSNALIDSIVISQATAPLNNHSATILKSISVCELLDLGEMVHSQSLTHYESLNPPFILVRHRLDPGKTPLFANTVVQPQKIPGSPRSLWVEGRQAGSFVSAHLAGGKPGTKLGFDATPLHTSQHRAYHDERALIFSIADSLHLASFRWSRWHRLGAVAVV